MADKELFDRLLWPHDHGEHSTFRAFKPEPRDPHGPWFLVMPGGDMLQLNHCSDDAVDEARCRWMVDALNRALTVDTLSGREAFEAAFPKLPMGVEWNGSDYVYPQDWERTVGADRFLNQWEGWKRRAASGVRVEGGTSNG